MRRQSNLDFSLTFCWLGYAEEAQAELWNAGRAFEKSVRLRNERVFFDTWDPTKAAALRSLESVSIRLGDVSNTSKFKELPTSKVQAIRNVTAHIAHDILIPERPEMSSKNNTSGCGDEYDSRGFVAKRFGANDEDLERWFEEYKSIDAEKLETSHNVIEAVSSDELDEDFVERQIQESQPSHVIRGICTKCQNLFDNWPTLDNSSTVENYSVPCQERWAWKHTVSQRSSSTFELEASMRAGCRFCAFLLQSLKDDELLETFRKIEVRLIHLHDDSTSSLSIQNFGMAAGQTLWLNLPGKICKKWNRGIAKIQKSGTYFLLDSDSDSADFHDELPDPDVLNTASSWLSNCTENHVACENNNYGTLPTRLILVAEESPRLVLMAEYTDRPRYATLSHCWGSQKPIELTSENLGSLMKEIPFETLPATFKDAVEIARRLGLHFIWIDSLCIIQNDADDWQKESALMSSVYGGSAINIAAYSARDSSQGCLLKSPNLSGGLRARITEGGRQRVITFRNSDEYRLFTSRSHLGTRAWAFQERILPPRTVYFGDRGAFWECGTTITSEFLLDMWVEEDLYSLVCRKDNLPRRWNWQNIVRDYSGANLSFGKDKLPGLSGIAKSVHDEIGDQYLAGLWKKQIEGQLCWYRLPVHKICMRPPWRAPTWSWASIDGPVHWYSSEQKKTKYAHVVDAHTTLYGHDPFGQVSDGVIRLACSTIAMGYLVTAKDNAVITLQIGDTKFEVSIILDCLNEMCLDYNEPIYLVPILSYESCGKNMIGGIVLRNTKTAIGEYSRIGSFWNLLFENSSGSTSCNPLMQILEEVGTATAEAACSEIIPDADPPDHRYLISII
ncbi:hypothetical protein NHQ30_009249 [Ciborinia camelliae]|nr:hypothetical protein NHQ30_009249 [Ciborinia camelliae]